MSRRRRLLLILILVPLALYGLILAGLWYFQERVLFPNYIVPAAGPLPAGATRLTIDAGEGVRLEGIHIPASAPRQGAALALVFVGNASNAQGVAEQLHDIWPERDVVAFCYRGYAPSTGVTAARALAEDAPLVHDFVMRRFRPGRVVAVGVSLGSGVAASLAAQRELAGLILVTPFDSLAATAAQHYPWLPVSWLLRHDIRSAELLAASRTPVAIVAAGADEVVPPERTAALRRALPRLVFDVTISEAHHNDIAFSPRFVPTMRAAMERVEAAR
ncbi:alpha/beta hydrolase [Sphingosinicella sp.]|uniref:alpha/beta hydrolase n=1 Tax=Sphingosinicella sp. TaxID=1917971 RepID=UPI004037AFFC